MNLNIERFIRDLYSHCHSISPDNFRAWALLQLNQVLNFDAAFWGTGHLGQEKFHYITQHGLNDEYGARLIHTLKHNPIREAVLNNLEHPISMSDVYPDEAFFQSLLYRELFEPYGIKRILATGHHQTDSDLYSLISLYRHQENEDFTRDEKEIMARLVYHLVSAASHNYFLHLQQAHQAAAICDAHGYYCEVQPEFFERLEQAGIDVKAQRYPLPLETQTFAPVRFEIAPLGGLYLITAVLLSPVDQLTERETQIVSWVVQGLTFKEVAKELNVAPSTISNHLYRIYKKLNISSRSELAKLINNNKDTD